MDDTITKLLRGVARGEISVDDARKSLEDASLTEEQMEMAIDKGVFTEADMGSIVSAKLAPSGASYLTMFFLHLGNFLVLLLDVFVDLWTSKRLGPTSTSIPSGHRRYNFDTDGTCLSKIHSS